MAELLTNLLNGSSSSSKKKKPSSSASATSKTPADSPSVERPSSAVAGSLGENGLFQDEIRIVADPGTNSIVVTATPNDYASLQSVIEQLDVRRPQVFVEALIMEVNMNKELNVGVTGHGGAANSQGIAFGGSGGGTLNPNLKDIAGAGGLVLGGFGKAMTLGGLSIPAQGFLFKAMQKNDSVNVLSAPNILTSDNKKAEIIVGKRVSVPTTSGQDSAGNPLRSFSTENVGLELHVTPQINDGDEVTLEIEQKIEDVIGSQEDLAKFGLRTDQRKAKTTVVAQNGQTVVIGGLIKDKEVKGKQKVPLLGDIPILGNLFKQTSVSNEKVNLMVFLTPTILRDPKDMTRVSVQKNDQRRRFNKKNSVGENKGLYNYGFDENMNMAPPVTDVAEPVRENRAPKKRFNYEQQELKNAQNNSDDASQERTEVRQRSDYTADATTKTGAKPVRSRESADSASANPFADIKPQ